MQGVQSMDANNKSLTMIDYNDLMKIMGGNSASQSNLPDDQYKNPYNLQGGAGADLHGNYGYGVSGTYPVNPNLNVNVQAAGNNINPVSSGMVNIYVPW